ncbi:porin [Vibrio sp. La 4.2.2]|uniref:porin n=1 Tax=Vibrio sp. La 4.2.2 TaxID=2998830 RepID=UPI0022CDC7B0|nr:porin [Vibrio sp. La 4.2.2]MDA0109155.1 porin [Vibrio sp. La 4.2.2]|eukprot:TRINITY_DN137631_c0_g3_i1.p1 TRINITY_DN137631_c0_g3~~TRINITY_DN137631_c0_g3_i1.p1  ORF type:complete len:352 (-),score=44.94 TRINITY_DN137631_c0_g3_i1:145-1200(-)
MKKTLVALAVLAAGSAQAGIEIYNENKVTVNLKGDIEVVYKKGFEDGAETKQEIQDADFGFDVRYAINDDLQFGAYWEFDGSADNGLTGNAVKAGNTYVGVYSQTAGSLIVGRLDSMLDDAGIGSDYQFGLNSFFSNGSPFGADESIRYDIDKGNFYGGIAYKQDKNGNAGLGTDGYMVDAKAGFRVADFDFTGFFGQADFKGDNLALIPDSMNDGDKETLYAIEGRWSGVENLNLELGYYNMKMDPKAGDSVTAQTFGFAADYTMNQWIFAAGVSQVNLSDDNYVDTSATSQVNNDKETNWFVNAGYKVAPSATVYAEVGGSNGYSETDTTNGYYTQNGVGFAIGAKAEF